MHLADVSRVSKCLLVDTARPDVRCPGTELGGGHESTDPYVLPNSNPSTQGLGCGAPSRGPSPTQAVKASWCSLFAAVVLAGCLPHPAFQS